MAQILHFGLFAGALFFASTAAAQDPELRSDKRGLIYIPPSNGQASVDEPFVSQSSDLTWYYNYNPAPTLTLSNATSLHPLEFVPQLWGASDDNGGEAFSGIVEPLLAAGNNISNLLFMNEPDIGDNGGSGVDPGDAAKLWSSQFAPLKKAHSNLNLGSPAVTNADTGFSWLAEWFAACDGGCEPDFMAVHYYGPYQGLVQHIQQVNSTFSNITSKGGIWVTEFAFPEQDMPTTESFFNQSVAYLDSQDVVKRYSYFGSFTSSASNVGSNVAMLDKNGRLTPIGSQYVGGGATGGAKGMRVSAISVMMSVLVGVVSWLL